MWDFGPGELWLAAALLLGIAELVVPGVFLIFLAIAAAATGVFTIVEPAFPAWAQLLSFAAWSVVTVMIGRRWYGNPHVDAADPLLNNRASRLIGSTVEVSTAIVDGRGRVLVGDGAWLAEGPDLPAGARARVVGAAGTVLLVAPIEPEG